MKLTARQRRALVSICDTFAPESEAWPSASALGVPQAIADAMDRNPRAADHQQFQQLLDLWDSSLHSVLTVGRLAPFSALPLEARIRVLLSWAESKLGRRRAAFQALRKAVSYLYLMIPQLNGTRTPVWPALKYPGPPNLSQRAASPQLPVHVPDRDLALSCEVCVIGSGAGGGTAAAVLSAAGKDLIVLEAGGYYDDADFDGAELGGYQRLYLEGGSAATSDHSVGLLAGECVGGGTVVNYTTSFRTPDDIRAEWSAYIPWIETAEYTASLDAVCSRLSVNCEHNQVSAREQVFERGLKALGWHIDKMPRNVRGCDPMNICGYCGFGCPIGAKQSTAKTWLADAVNNGVRIFAQTRADKLRMEAGRVTGVEATSKRGQHIAVTCKSVVVACGAIHSPALLLRSGLNNEHIGRHLHLHPVSNVCGVFDEEIRPWEGTLQAIYSDEHRSLTGNFGLKYETTALQPVIASAALPWRNPKQHRYFLEHITNTVGIGVLVRDRDGGRVTTDLHGNAVANYSLSPFDRGHLCRGFISAARILEAAGARIIYSPHAKWCSYEPAHNGSIDTFTQAMDSAGWDSGRLALFSFHIMGTARMGTSPRSSVTNPDGETWEVRNLYVMDGSSFPSASGVNPMITIEAIAHRNASALAAKT
jgi:long-chain-alcohol oxidase